MANLMVKKKRMFEGGFTYGCNWAAPWKGIVAFLSFVILATLTLSIPNVYAGEPTSYLKRDTLFKN